MHNDLRNFYWSAIQRIICKIPNSLINPWNPSTIGWTGVIAAVRPGSGTTGLRTAVVPIVLTEQPIESFSILNPFWLPPSSQDAYCYPCKLLTTISPWLQKQLFKWYPFLIVASLNHLDIGNVQFNSKSFLPTSLKSSWSLISLQATLSHFVNSKYHFDRFMIYLSFKWYSFKW